MNAKNHTRHLFGSIFFAISFLVATGTSAFAQSSGQLLPFHAVLVGIERTDIPNEIDPDYPAWEDVIVGKATHLGKTSGSSVNNSFAFRVDAIGFHLVGVTVATTVAANGDELEITTDWRYYMHSDVVYGDWEITGGTGRFENATGEGTSEGRDNEDGDRVHVYDGKINY